MSQAYPLYLRTFDCLSMNNPFSGSCDGVSLITRATFPEQGPYGHVPHQWLLLENEHEPIDRSCGSVIMDADGKIMGFF